MVISQSWIGESEALVQDNFIDKKAIPLVSFHSDFFTTCLDIIMKF